MPHGGREKENQVPPMLRARLISRTSKKKKSEKTLAHTRLEMEVISQCGSGGLEDYKPSRTIIVKMKLDGQLNVVEYIRIIEPESVHMGDPAGGYMEKAKARSSARGHLMAWHDKNAMQEYLMNLVTGSYLKRKEYSTVVDVEADQGGGMADPMY